MATKRRGGFRPPELRGTLGTLIRTTTGVVRDAIERGTREGRARLDDVRTSRRRQDALAELGELVLDLIRRGEIDLAELPEAHDLVRQLDELDADEPEPAPPPRASLRRRFDDRPHRFANGGDRPSRFADRDDGRPRRFTGGDDGTVSSGAADRFARPGSDRPKHLEPPSARAPTRPMKTVWPPPSDNDLTSAAAASVPAGPAARPDPQRPPLPTDPHRKGGISFDDDDLSDYMHPDDVPPRAAPTDPDDHDA